MTFMHSRPPDTALRDILHHIELATSFAQGLGQAEFLDNSKTVYAMTRCLEIISEASRRLPEAVKARHPVIPWKQMAAAGNVYRHDYEDVTSRTPSRVICPPCARPSCRRSIGLAK